MPSKTAFLMGNGAAVAAPLREASAVEVPSAVPQAAASEVLRNSRRDDSLSIFPPQDEKSEVRSQKSEVRTSAPCCPDFCLLSPVSCLPHHFSRAYRDQPSRPTPHST